MERYNNILKNKTFISAILCIEKKEENRVFCKHGMTHILDTARVAYILALENKLDISKDIIYATALLHDLGRSVDDDSHNIESGKLAESILYDCGYDEAEVSEICYAIENHRKSVVGIESLADLISAADHLSRQCYSCKAYNDCYWSENRKNHKIIY